MNHDVGMLSVSTENVADKHFTHFLAKTGTKFRGHLPLGYE